ncbi:UNVERIFIED_ORG: hypothetical protein J2X79_004373 [Arthrobacter globiformis]|nr:hypothetical protein [Arthrobacter globiformis]
MPITSNVAWDRRLEVFKGRDTAQYIDSVMASAKHCAACRLRLGAGDALSLTVDITESHGLEDTVCLSFDPAVCHLRCQEPGLRVRQTDDARDALASIGARMVLSGGGLGKTNIPVLAYTLVPSLASGEPGGEMTSALVSALLNHGFQLSLTASYRDIVQQAIPVGNTCTCPLAGGGTVQLHIDRELMHSQQLDEADAGDAAWLEGYKAGHVLVISGDNLVFTDTGLELAAAARLGTLVAGIVPVPQNLRN